MAEQSWRARPVLALLLRVAALLVPLLAGISAAVTLATALPAATSVPARVGWWVAVLGGSVLATYGTDRLARRVLPLAVLLELSLVFPDRAPSRLRAIRSSSVRELDNKLARLRGQGVPMEPYEAAETLVTLVGVLGLHDKRTRGHSERVRALTDLLTDELGLPEHDRVRLRWAALVHDLGKLTVPTGVLNGTEQLAAQEWEQLRRHPDEGVRLVQGLLPFLGEWGAAVGQHHERWDGAGYPRALSGEQISYAARLVAVCDSFETMTSVRSYKPARSAADGRRELARCAGSQFDPAVVRAFLRISLGRLTWVLGPVTWLAQIPFVAAVDRAGQAVKAGAVTVAVGGLIGLGALPGPSAATAAATPGPGAAGAVPSGGTTGGVTAPLALSSGPDPSPPSPAGPVAPGAAAPEPGTSAPTVSPSASAVSPAPSPTAPAPSPAAPTPSTSAPSPSPAAPALTPVSPVEPSPVAASPVEPSPVAASPVSGVVAPTAAPTPPAPPSPSPSAPPSSPPSPSPSALPVPVPLATTYTNYLAPGRLTAEVPPRSVDTVPRGGGVTDDRTVDLALTITGTPRVVLLLDFQDRTGSPRFHASLLDCAAGGTACTELAAADVAQDRSRTAPGVFVAYDTALVRSTDAPQVVAAGRVLRLALTLSSNGAKADVLLALGSGGPVLDGGPSRLEVPATVLAAATTDAAPVGPSVLLGVLALLGLSARLPARRSPLRATPPPWRRSRLRQASGPTTRR